MSQEETIILKNRKRNIWKGFIYWVKCRLGLRCYILQKDAHKSFDNIRLPRSSRLYKDCQTRQQS